MPSCVGGYLKTTIHYKDGFLSFMRHTYKKENIIKAHKIHSFRNKILARTARIFQGTACKKRGFCALEFNRQAQHKTDDK